MHPLIDHCCAQFASVYHPNCEVAVDEAMIKFQGRSSLKQYMPMKPIKRGIKVCVITYTCTLVNVPHIHYLQQVWVLADSCNGYFWQVEVYTGRKERSEQGLGYRVVRDLTADLKGRNHQVYCDNFFTTTNLVEELAADNIFSCGTARKDRRGFPSVLKEVRLKNRYGPPHTHTTQSPSLLCTLAHMYNYT